MHRLKNLVNLTMKGLEEVLQGDYNNPEVLRELLLLALMDSKKKTIQLEFCLEENKKVAENLDRIKGLIDSFKFQN